MGEGLFTSPSLFVRSGEGQTFFLTWPVRKLKVQVAYMAPIDHNILLSNGTGTRTPGMPGLPVARITGALCLLSQGSKETFIDSGAHDQVADPFLGVALVHGHPERQGS